MQNFIKLLNKVRENKIDIDILNELNKRYDENISKYTNGYIMLTTHNSKANEINEFRLKQLEAIYIGLKHLLSMSFREFIS